MIKTRYYSPLVFIFFSITISLCTIYSCKQNIVSNDKIAKPADTIAFYKLPENLSVSNNEKQRISDAANAWYNAYLGAGPFTGSILVAKNGEVMYEKYSGNINPNSVQAVDAHTPMHIASVSKTFTAMAILHLAQEGKIVIDSSFSFYFPQFNWPGITVRSLLDHRSGLPNYPYFMEKLWEDKSTMVRNEDVLSFLINKKGLLPAPGAPDSHFSYCNTNYALLALLIEKVSGKSYPDYMEQNIFRPLQMNDTHVFLPSDTSSVTKSFDWRGRLIPFDYLDRVYGDKNIYSTTHDLLRWDKLLKTNLFVDDISVQQAYAPYSNEHAGMKNYGLGWRMLLYPEGKKIIFHNGWWHGNTAAFIRLLDENVTIIVLSNKYNRGTYKAKMLANIFYPYFNQEPEEDEQQDFNITKTDSLLQNPTKKK